MQDETSSLLVVEAKDEGCGTTDAVEISESMRSGTATSSAAVLTENTEQSQAGDDERGNRPKEQQDPETGNLTSDHVSSLSSGGVEGDLIMGVPRETVEELMKAWSKVLIQSLQSQGREGRSDGLDVELGLRNPRETPFNSSESNVDMLYDGLFPNAGNSSDKEENDRALAMFRRIPQENGRYVKRPVFGAFNNYGYPDGQTAWFGEPVQVMDPEDMEKEDEEWEREHYRYAHTWRLKLGSEENSNVRPKSPSGSATRALLSLLYTNAEASSKYGHCHVNLIHSSIQKPNVSLTGVGLDICKSYLGSLGPRKRFLILVEHLKERKQYPLPTLLKRCYARGILDQTLELPRHMFGLNLFHGPVLSNDSSVSLTQSQTHALNAWVIIDILRTIDIWDIYPRTDDCFGGMIFSVINDIYFGHHAKHTRAQDLMQFFYTSLEESESGFETFRFSDVDQQISDDELKESSFPISDLGINSLQSLGKIKIRWVKNLNEHLRLEEYLGEYTLHIFWFSGLFASRVSRDYGEKWQEKEKMWNEVMQTWRILFAFDNRDIIERETFLSAYNAIKPPWFVCYESSNGVPRVDRATLRLVTDIKAIRENEKLKSMCGDVLGHLSAHLQTKELPTQVPYKIFPIYGNRLRELHAYMNRQQPKGFRDLWRDKRNVANFWTFWLVVIFGAISVFLAVASLAVSSAQAWAAFHPPGS